VNTCEVKDTKVSKVFLSTRGRKMNFFSFSAFVLFLHPHEMKMRQHQPPLVAEKIVAEVKKLLYELKIAKLNLVDWLVDLMYFNIRSSTGSKIFCCSFNIYYHFIFRDFSDFIRVNKSNEWWVDGLIVGRFWI